MDFGLLFGFFFPSTTPPIKNEVMQLSHSMFFEFCSFEQNPQITVGADPALWLVDVLCH
jgi:hypothetical protein